MADEEEEVQPVVARIYTDFFKRDAQIYALGDIRFNKPKSLKTVGYTLALLFIWGFPMMLLIGVERVFSNVLWAAVVVGPPVGLGIIMGKPMFYNKPLLKCLKSIYRYTQESTMYADLVGYEYTNVDEVEVKGSAWLADADCYDDLIEEEREKAEAKKSKALNKSKPKKPKKK